MRETKLARSYSCKSKILTMFLVLKILPIQFSVAYANPEPKSEKTYIFLNVYNYSIKLRQHKRQIVDNSIVLEICLGHLSIEKNSI